MGKGRHVVIHDVIHDDNEMGNLWATDQLSGRIFTHNLGNSPIGDKLLATALTPI